MDEKSEVINNEEYCTSADLSTTIAANITIDDTNRIYSSDSENDRHFLSAVPLSSTTFVSINDESDIDLANPDDQRKLFSHILDNICNLEQNLEKEKMNNILLGKSFKVLETKLNETLKKIKSISSEVCYLQDELYKIDCRLIETEQYSRHENLIISGIPESIKQEVLEQKVINIMKTIGLNITSYEIAACHRLRKAKNSRYPAPTIVRFTNRKAVDFCLINRSRLNRYKQELKLNLRFYENLCEANESVIHYCSKLKQSGIIYDFYLRNGFVKIIIDEGDKPINIRHPEDLFSQFEDFFS